METLHKGFDEYTTLQRLKHFLPGQALPKGFIHHNGLQAFNDKSFFEALNEASQLFGYQVFLPLADFRKYYCNGTISRGILERIIINQKGRPALSEWLDKMLDTEYNVPQYSRIGQLRAQWQEAFAVNPEGHVHSLLFSVLRNCFGQGGNTKGNNFLASVKELPGIFTTARAQQLFNNPDTSIASLLSIIVGNESYYEQYLFDQQFAHLNLSRLVIAEEEKSVNSCVSLHDFIFFELLLEIDTLDKQLGTNWKPLVESLNESPVELFAPVQKNELFEVMALWQSAFEWTYYDEVLAGINYQKKLNSPVDEGNFPSVFYKQFSKKLLPERCLYLNLFDHKTDPQGDYLFNILKALGPMPGAINLEDYSSKAGSYTMGTDIQPEPYDTVSGTVKGYDNGLFNGDPNQMLAKEIYGPVRLLAIIEHYPDVIKKQLVKDAATYNWYKNQWLRLVVIHPETGELFIFENERFIPYTPLLKKIYALHDLDMLVESTADNVSVYLLN